MKLRVLQGVTGQAGQPSALADGLRKIGLEASSCSILPHKFGYQADIHLDMGGAHTLGEVSQRIAPLLAQFDVFHFHARSFCTEWPHHPFPSMMDLLVLKLAGKKVFFHFRGQDIRMADQFALANPFHFVNEPAGHLFKNLPDASKRALRDFTLSVCDAVFVTDPELGTYVPDATVIARALDGVHWPYVGVNDTDRPLVIHAPSRRGVKGTDHIVAAVDELKSAGLSFDFQLVEGMTNEEARRIYRKADIVIDQLRIGWYGVLAVEAMALGKPVIAYIREDLSRTCDTPVVNANPHTIKAKLKELLVSAENRRRIGMASRKYFEQEHEACVVARKLKTIYEMPPKQMEYGGIVQMLDFGSRRFDPSVVRYGSLWMRRFFHLIDIGRADGIKAAYTTAASFARHRIRKTRR